jgi:hypothetical protein
MTLKQSEGVIGVNTIEGKIEEILKDFIDPEGS